MDWMTEELNSESQKGKKKKKKKISSPSHPDDSGAHPASYPKGTGGSFPGY
jgi:hypothetical protein